MPLTVAGRRDQNSESVIVSIRGDKRDELEDTQEPHRMATAIGNQILGHCGIDPISPIYPVTKDGPYKTWPTSEEIKANPTIGWQQDFKCLKKI